MTLVNWGQTKNIMIVCLLIFTTFFKCAIIWKQNNCVLLTPPRPPYSFKDKKQLGCSHSQINIYYLRLSIPFLYQNSVFLCLAVTPAQRVTVLHLQPFSRCTHAFKPFIQLHFHIWGYSETPLLWLSPKSSKHGLKLSPQSGVHWQRNGKGRILVQVVLREGWSLVR